MNPHYESAAQSKAEVDDIFEAIARCVCVCVCVRERVAPSRF
jgi:hypothetical protein